MRNLFKTTKHYLKVYRMFMMLSFNGLLAYRADLINSVVSNFFWGSFSIVSMLFLTSRASSVFGWTRDELLILAGLYNIIFSIFYMLFSMNFGEFSKNINYGRLDGILIKPIDSQFFITCKIVRHTQIVRFTIGLGFIIYILNKTHTEVTAMSAIWFVVFLILSIVILYSLWMLIMTLTIWYTKLSNLVEFLYEIHGVAKFPQEIYKGASLYIYFLLFPLTLVVVVPAKAILNKILLGDILWPFIVAMVMFYMSRKFWRFALRSYSSASG